MSRGRKAEPEIAFSTTGKRTRSRSLAPRSISIWARRQHGRGAAHVLLHVQHAAFGLDIEPAGVEANALADQRDLGMGRIAPAHVDEARRLVGGAADRMDERKILGEEIGPDDRPEGRAMPGRHRARGCLELGRPHVVGRRVDQVAGEPDRLRDAGQVGAVEAGDELKPHLLGLGLALGLAIAREAIGSERKSERRQARVVRRIGEPVGARRQQGGERARPQQILGLVVRVLEPEQHARQRAVGAGQQEVPAGLGLEAGGIREGAAARIEAVADFGPGRGGDERHRHRCGRAAGGDEVGGNRGMRHGVELARRRGGVKQAPGRLAVPGLTNC